jgi:hypothetical protein
MPVLVGDRLEASRGGKKNFKDRSIFDAVQWDDRVNFDLCGTKSIFIANPGNLIISDRRETPVIIPYAIAARADHPEREVTSAVDGSHFDGLRH